MHYTSVQSGRWLPAFLNLHLQSENERHDMLHLTSSRMKFRQGQKTFSSAE